MLLLFQEGQRIPLTNTHILHAGSEDGDNPVVNAITDFLTEQHTGNRYSADFCFIDEDITVYQKGTGKRVARLYTSTMLEDWLRTYFNGEKVSPFTIKVYHQRDDNDEIEDERLWVGIAEDEGFNLSSCVNFDKLDGMERRVTREHINDSMQGDCQYCVIANVLSELFSHYEINVDGAAAAIHTRGKVHASLLISERLGKWIDAYDNGADVGTFILIIKTLENNPSCKYLLDIKDLTDRQKDLQQRSCLSKNSPTEVKPNLMHSCRNTMTSLQKLFTNSENKHKEWTGNRPMFCYEAKTEVSTGFQCWRLCHIH